ncbi:aspartate--tRNA(Asn) ligase, partial [Ruminococcaceae bacterium OttesenSCG-928-D13]|nr:aspartate--tRNA(Asn) ligase [Ruminococcaceae bacterium OttesenSCG-928-D13]
MESISANLSSSHVDVEQLRHHIGQVVEIHGIIHKIREMSGFAFVILRMKNTLLQCVYLPDCSRFELSALQENASVIFTGQVVDDKRSRTGLEIRLISFKLLSRPLGEPPVVINNKEVAASLETLLDYRPITLRNTKERAIFQIQAGLCRGFRRFFDANGFTEIHSPKIVFSGAEGGANIFKLDYFGKDAYLTQSPQFYKQMMVGVYERVYEIAPVFRAEKHDTSRHINEYTSVDLEMGFLDSFYDIMRLETGMLAETLEFIKKHYA